MNCNLTLLKPSGKISKFDFEILNEKAAKTSLASHKSCEEMRGTDRLTASGRFSTLRVCFSLEKISTVFFSPKINMSTVISCHWDRKRKLRPYTDAAIMQRTDEKQKKTLSRVFFFFVIRHFSYTTHLEPRYRIFWFKVTRNILICSGLRS